MFCGWDFTSCRLKNKPVPQVSGKSSNYSNMLSQSVMQNSTTIGSQELNVT